MAELIGVLGGIVPPHAPRDAVMSHVEFGNIHNVATSSRRMHEVRVGTFAQPLPARFHGLSNLVKGYLHHCHGLRGR